MVPKPVTSAVSASASPPHHSIEGLRSRALSTSRVTSAGCLLPPISGTRTRATPLAIPSLLAARRCLVADQFQIANGRLGVQFFEHAERTLAGRRRRHAAVRIVQVAEHDRLGRTGLLAGGLDRTV